MVVISAELVAPAFIGDSMHHLQGTFQRTVELGCGQHNRTGSPYEEAYGEPEVRKRKRRLFGATGWDIG